MAYIPANEIIVFFLWINYFIGTCSVLWVIKLHAYTILHEINSLKDLLLLYGFVVAIGTWGYWKSGWAYGING